MAHPEQLGKYTIKTLLGTGAMGVVYKAYDPDIGRLVALKTIRQVRSKDDDADASLTDRFRNEARAVGRLNHPGIVAIYELGHDGDCDFIAMEYVEGRDLSQILLETPTLPEADVLLVMQQLLDALSCAHQQGVWHRDIKPANLIITTAGQLKVTDFGIARIESAALTMVTSTIGTPGYMAPEQYSGEHIDHRVDIFAAGILLYRMLTGRAPFSGTQEVVMYGILTKEPPPLGQFVDAEVATFYTPVIARAMAKDPAQRYPTAAAFREALQLRSASAASSSGDTTVIVHAARKREEGPVSAGAHSHVSGQSALTALTHWQDATLIPVQSVLARFMGPMAKVLVRQAAKKCTDLPTLVGLVAQEIPDTDDRAKFLELLQRQTGTGVGSLATSVVTAAAAGLSAIGQPLALPTPLIERATQFMTRQMGPIAKIVVKKAAARAQSPQQFLALLADELPVGPQRAKLIEELSSCSSSVRDNIK